MGLQTVQAGALARKIPGVDTDAQKGGTTVYTFGPLGASDLNNTTYGGPVIDHDFDVESVTLRAGTAGSAHAVTVRVAASGTAVASGTAIGSGVASGLTANTSFDLSGLASNTGFKAGSQIGVSGASGLTTLAGLWVAVRVTQKRLTSTDAGTRVYRGE